ncbi:MAG: alpha/beta hydrolase family protein [Marinicellaceae bacterium]
MQIKSLNGHKKIKFQDIEAGNHYALIKLKAGDYYWDIFNLTSYWKNIVNYDQGEKKFKVEAGIINYPGSWVSSLEYRNYRSAHYLNSENNMSVVLKKFREQHTNLYNKYTFKYQGLVEDNYPAYYKKLSESFKQTEKPILFNSVSTEPNQNEYNYYDSSDGIDDELKSYPKLQDYLENSNQSIGRINPSGNFLTYSVIEDEVTYIKVLNLSSYVADIIYQQKLSKKSYIEEIEWIDNNSIFFKVNYLNTELNQVVHLTIDNENKITGAKHLEIPLKGDLVDSLIEQEDKIYFSNKFNRSYKKVGLYELNLETFATIKKSAKKPLKKLKKFENAAFWLTDKSSLIRFLITVDYNKKADHLILDYWFLNQKNKWKKIKTFESVNDLEIPQLISSDGTYFYVLTNKFGDKKAIHKYSTHDFSYIEPFYENDNIDIVGINSDPSTHEINGINYINNGFYKVEYLENKIDSLKPLKQKYPNYKFYNVQNNIQNGTILVFGSNEYSKGSWSIYNKNTKEFIKLFEVNQEYSKLEKGKFHYLNIKASDGVNIEGYLVTPSDEKEEAPLIVIPHGGPIGVRDYAFNNDLQHFLASQGFASLKINYRGSGGYGKEFIDKGKQQWGEKIESDINEMVDYSIDNFNIKESHICSMGSSYGGYSALMLTILYPDRYKCAVSLAGVTDIPLLFTKSDFKYNEYMLEKMTEIAGNPIVNHQGLVNKSPLYLVNKIKRPFLLFHGLNDSRVTIEHSYRMKEILDLVGQKTNLVVLNDEGHSFSEPESEIIYIARSLKFIQDKLNITSSGLDSVQK